MNKASKKNNTVKKINGIAVLVKIFRAMDPLFRKKKLLDLSAKDPVLGQLLESHLIVFADIAKLESMHLQRLISKTPEQTWILALLSCDEVLQKYIISQLSVRKQKEWSDEIREKRTSLKVFKLASIKAQIFLAARLKALLEEGYLKIGKRSNLSSK